MLAAAALAAALCAPVLAADEKPATSPFAGRGLMGRADYSAEELAELDGLEETVQRFEEQAAE